MNKTLINKNLNQWGNMLLNKNCNNTKKEGSICSVFYTGTGSKKKIFMYLFPFFTCNGGQHPPECHAKYYLFLPPGVGGQLSPEYPAKRLKIEKHITDIYSTALL